jgi:ketosteroid isomerase-like protein
MAKLPFWSAAAFFLAPLAAAANGSTTLEQQVVEDDQINYVTGNPASWPAKLEATIAAPDNHKILLENERVRVLEVTLDPGEVEPLHFHRWPSVLHITQADEWIDRDAQGSVIFDSRAGPPLQLPLTMWKGPEAPHSPVNLSDSVEVRLIRVEIKDGAGEADLTPILDNRTRVIIEGIRSGDVSGIMALYGPGSLYAPNNATLLSDAAAIREFWVSVAASPAHDARLEVLRIERLGPDAFVEIQKYDVFDDAGERLFGGYASLLWRRVEGRWIIAADVSN